MKVLDFPLVKITASFILGILVSYYWLPTILIALLALIASFIFFITTYLLTKRNSKVNLLFGASAYFISFFVDCNALLFNTDSLQKSNYIHCKKAFEAPHFITFILRKKLKSNYYNDRYTAIINQIDNKDYSGKIIVNIPKDSAKNTLIIGNIIRAKQPYNATIQVKTLINLTLINI